jgi:hypothetical protein
MATMLLTRETHTKYPRLHPTEGCVDLPLFLLDGQLAALEQQARSEGRTIGETIRQAIRLYLAGGCNRCDSDCTWGDVRLDIPPDGSGVEVTLLLPTSRLVELEALAVQRDTTTAALIRQAVAPMDSKSTTIRRHAMSVELHEEADGTILNLNRESSPTHSAEHSLSQLVEEARRHWEAQWQPGAAQRDISSPTSRTFTVALSREVGTQGNSVAKEVGKLLGWHVYGHELLEYIALEMGLRTALVESVDERQQRRLLELVEEFATAPAKSDWGAFVSESAYVHHLIETVLALGVHGECVIVGRGAAFALPAATTLRVRLVGPVRERITELSERTDFVQDHFSKDPSDPRNYDLVLSTSRLTVAQCAELIVETLKRLQAPGKEKTTAQQLS